MKWLSVACLAMVYDVLLPLNCTLTAIWKSLSLAEKELCLTRNREKVGMVCHRVGFGPETG